MNLRYDPAVVESFETETTPELVRLLKQLVALGFMGYRVEDDGRGGFRLDYFSLVPDDNARDPGEAA